MPNVVTWLLPQPIILMLQTASALMVLGTVLGVGGVAWAYSHWRTAVYAASHPPAGSFLTVSGHRLHYVLQRADAGPAAPTLVFIHGASANLHDPVAAYSGAFDCSVNRLYIDRPGHGWSTGGPDVNGFPDRQADLIAGLLDQLGIETALFVGHSYGASVVAALALARPEKVAGLVFVAPATHPWPGGVSWYHGVATMPYVGWLFTRLVALPAAERIFKLSVVDVFAPDPVPVDYIECTATRLAFRPESFRNNSRDIAGLHEHVMAFHDRYRTIAAPTAILTGTRDSVVLPGIHSYGLKRVIAGSVLIVCDGAGHMPHHLHTELVVTAIFDVLAQTGHARTADLSNTALPITADKGDA